jgi:ribosomal protein S18 acetylase RimI-like enzyme
MLPVIRGNALPREFRREALTLLFEHADESAMRTTLALEALENGELDPAGLLTCWEGNCCLGVLVVEILPGNSASVWPICARPNPGRLAVEDSLFAEAHQWFRQREIAFAQAILRPEHEDAANALGRNGFACMAHFNKMACILPDKEAAISNDIRMEMFSASNAAEFRDVLMATFEESRDCPELNGLRSANEVLAGHKATAPDLSRWWLARSETAAVGVVILANSPVDRIAELAYLGVVPSARRRGYGRALTSFALDRATSDGAKGLTLLVDQRNHPAFDLYTSIGCQTNE